MDDFSPNKRNFFDEEIKPKASGLLAEQFLVPPFSVLSARDGNWQSRKRAWIRLGIKSEVGRGGDLYAVAYNIGDKAKFEQDYNHASPGGSALPAANYKNRERGSGSGSAIAGTSATSISQKLAPGGGGCWLGGPKTKSSGKFSKPLKSNTSSSSNAMEYAGGFESATGQSGTSIFDPVLCELAYKWFCPPGGQVVDPFAGGSVRGIIASLLGYRYYGIELSSVQVAANEEQRTEICTNTADANGLEWRCGDSLDLLEDAPKADFIFTCPPYGNLEKYSDDPRDLSNMEYHTFVANYKRIILRAVKCLKQDRFACFVVGNYRNPKTGNYRDLVSDTIAGFDDAGCGYYNEAILVTAVGSLPICARKQFVASRKLGKTHQNILVFVKGDGKKAAKGLQPFMDK